jgi:hypothetical protein
MGVFKNTEQFYACVGELMDRARVDPAVGPKIAKSGVIIQFRYFDPEAVTTVDARGKPTQPGAFCDVIHGPCTLEPDVIMSMKADIAHAFWHGKINLAAALVKKDIVIDKGSKLTVLKLLPAVEPLYKLYPALLREKGYAALVMK